MKTPTMTMVLAILLPLLVLILASKWAIFKKASQPGIFAIIPIFNIIILLKIIKRPWWWVFLWLIPVVGLIWRIQGWILMVRYFGKPEAFGVGCVFVAFIALPILAFDGSKFDYATGKTEEKEEEEYIQDLIEKSGGEGKAVAINDTCPACGAKITGMDKSCPDCGLALQ
jgi:hypothetical protein